MRKPIAVILSLLLIPMLAAPAAAASPEYNLKLNDAPYTGVLSVDNGTTMIPLGFIEKALGAEATVENDQIEIVKEGSVMELKFGSTEASFNGRIEAMPLAPYKANDDYILPLRYVLEAFGAKVDWNAATYEISVASPQVNISAAEQLLGKISEATMANNTYKMKSDVAMQMDMNMDGQNINMKMSGDLDASIQQKPMLITMTMAMKLDEISAPEEMPAGEIPEELLKSQMVVNENGFFMTMPGVDGWVKLDEMEGLDFNKLMEQYGSQDPVQSIMQMREFGAEVTILEDKVIDGKAYGVLNIVMGQEALANYLNDIMGQLGGLGVNLPEAEKAEFDAVMKDLFSNINADIAYDIVYDKDTFLPAVMELDMTMNMNMTIPANEELETPEQTMQIKMNQKAAYQMYDYGVEFEVPVIEEYKTMDEIMSEAAAMVPEPTPEQAEEEALQDTIDQ